MSNNAYPLAVKPPSPVVKLDRRQRKELSQQTSRIARIAEVSRVAMDEISTNYVVAEKLTAQALTTSHVIHHTVPQSPGSDAYHSTLTQQYLQQMVAVTRSANDAILRRLDHENR